MKFTIQSNILQKNLNHIFGVVPSKSPLPILENFLFEISSKELIVTATDIDNTMHVKIPIISKDNCSIVIPAKKLLDTLRNLPDTDIEFDIDNINNKIKMKAGKGEYRLSGNSSDDYPKIEKYDYKNEYKIKGEVLKRLINKTLFATSPDELRPAMMGILFQLNKKEIKTIATDGHRLVKMCYSVGAEKEVDMIIPSKAMGILSKCVDDNECILLYNDKNIKIVSGDITLITRLIDEKYPKYESVIPVDNEKKLIVNKNELLTSVKRTSLYANLTTHQVKFKLEKNLIIVSAEDIDFGNDAKEEIICEYKSEPMDIGFNSAYIIDILTRIDTEEVQFDFSSPSRAAIIKPAIQKEAEDLLMLVMPVRLNT